MELFKLSNLRVTASSFQLKTDVDGQQKALARARTFDGAEK